MKKRKTTKLISQITKGLFTSLTDLVLWYIFFSVEMGFVGSPRNINKAYFLSQENLKKFNSQTIMKAVARTKARGFIKNDFSLTKEGKERLERVLPKFFGKRKWDGNWHLVIYDIPEKFKYRRNILRENLKCLGFGQLQASVWVSPFNFFGEVEKIIRDYGLMPYVIFSISDKLGKKEARILAQSVWHLRELDALYGDLLVKLKKESKGDLYFEYLQILEKDPQLPNELLPSGWRGKAVNKIFGKIKL